MDFFTTEILLSFITLTLLEIVLGIDNLIFIAIVVQKLPNSFRKKARLIGLGLALGIRIAMLFGVAWIMQLTHPIFSIGDFAVSVKDLLLLAGGIFLIAKSTLEMHHDVVGIENEREINVRNTFGAAIIQISMIDFVFSFDSIITAVGLTTNIPVIIAAVVISMGVMLACAGQVTNFLEKFPTFKMLALSFILMIGLLLVAEGMHFHVPRGYLYFAFSFSLFVEAMNVSIRRREKLGNVHIPKPKQPESGRKKR